jgi:CO/xanthine dehydrogenase Mo-binding subunit
MAGNQLGTDPAELTLKDGTISHAGSGESMSVNELFTEYDHPGSVSVTALKRGGELLGTATYDSAKKHACWTPVGQSALVAVNRLTGQVDVLWFHTTCDAGYAINPKAVEQQLEGAAAQGISSALYEEVVFNDGQVINPNFKDYRIPGPTELPYDSETTILETNDDDGPYGAKGIGEIGAIVSAPAVGNAVSNALDVEFDMIPMTPERILEALGST